MSFLELIPPQFPNDGSGYDDTRAAYKKINENFKKIPSSFVGGYEVNWEEVSGHPVTTNQVLRITIEGQEYDINVRKV